MKYTLPALLTIFIVLVGHLSYSQADHIGGAIHLTLPVGDFADEDEGNAEMGWLIKGQYDHLFNEQLGLCGTAFYGQNPFDDEGFSSNADIGPYNHFGVFLGGVASFGSEDIRFKIRAMPGVISSSTPEFKDGNVVIISEASATAIGVDIGISGEFAVSNDVSISIGVDYMSWKPEFTFESSSVMIKGEQQIALFTVGGGVVFVL